MIKRLSLLIIALASLVGFLAFWPKAEKSEDGLVKGRQIQLPAATPLLTKWEHPFLSDKEGAWKIYFFNETQPEPVALLPGPGNQYLPAKIDSDHWLYLSEEDGFFSLWRISLSEQTRDFIIALRQRPASLQTSADGRWAIYTLPGAKAGFNLRNFLLNLQTGQTKEILPVGRDLRFSHSGKQLTFATEAGVHLSEMMQDEKISEPLLVASGDISTPIFSRNSERLYFIRKGAETNTLAAVELGSGNEIRLASFETGEATFSWQLELSPDGKRLLYSGFDSNTRNSLIGHLLVDGSGQKEFENVGQWAHWSESGNHLLYNVVTSREGRFAGQIWRMDLEGNNREAITRSHDNWFAPTPPLFEENAD